MNAPTLAPEGRAQAATIAVVVLTHNRCHLLRRCVEDVLMRTSAATRELVIWDNASTDETRDYLDSIADPRFRVVHHERNIGMNGYARAVRLTSSRFIVEVDDDIVDAPRDWDRMLLEAFVRLPDVGFLAADLQDDPHDIAAHHRYRVRPHEYVPFDENGVGLLTGPAGGGCAMTSRAVYDQVGGFREDPEELFWLEDAAYIEDIQALGFRAVVLRDLKVRHAGGPYYADWSDAKKAYWEAWRRRRARRAAVKRALLRVPLVRPLNARYAWFEDPASAAAGAGAGAADASTSA
jgi:GT2 family glycosyltransferase